MATLGREDVERIVENVLRGLSLSVKTENWTDPNTRTISLKYNGIELSSIDVDVANKPEYEG